jgi:hypothetical protein
MDLRTYKSDSQSIYTFTETTEHPDGGDRGGYTEESYQFNFVTSGGNGELPLLTHEYDPGDSGLSVAETVTNFDLCPENLATKEDAINFVKTQIEGTLDKLETLKELKLLLETPEIKYVDATDSYGDDEEDEDK